MPLSLSDLLAQGQWEKNNRCSHCFKGIAASEAITYSKHLFQNKLSFKMNSTYTAIN